jgi:hypothetical protein
MSYSRWLLLIKLLYHAKQALYQTRQRMRSQQLHIGAVGRRGFEPLKSKDSGFTVRPIWPLWNLPVYVNIQNVTT